MGLDTNALVVAAQGYIFIGDVGKEPPSPSDLASVNAETFGCQVSKVVVGTTATSYTLTVGPDATSAIDVDATPDEVQSALEALDGIGAGNVLVSGTDVTVGGYSLTFIGELQGQSVTLTGTSTPSGTVTVTATTSTNGWLNVGHTSRDDLPEWDKDGGDKKVEGSWQQQLIREVATGDPRVDYLKITFEQWTTDTLELYYGANASDVSGEFGIDGSYTPIEKSMLMLIVDGDNTLGFYAPKVSFTGDDSPKLSTEKFATLPVKATFLDTPGHNRMRFINADWFV